MRRFTVLLLLSFALVVTGCSWMHSQESKTKNWSAQQFYQAGKSELASGNYEKGIKYFEQLESRYPYGPYAEQAQLEIAYAYYKSGESESAVAAAERFIRLHPTNPHVDYAYYLKGLANFSTKRSFLDRLGGQPDMSDRDPDAAKQAFESLRELVTRFPNSRYTADARQRMAYLLNALARHDIFVAKYYLSRHAYVAAVNRCRHVIDHYQNAPAVEDALGVMAIAYQKMNLPQLSRDTARVLAENFPHSRYLAEIKKLFGG